LSFEMAARETLAEQVLRLLLEFVLPGRLVVSLTEKSRQT
jgi:hypothetical protein